MTSLSKWFNFILTKTKISRFLLFGQQHLLMSLKLRHLLDCKIHEAKNFTFVPQRNLFHSNGLHLLIICHEISGYY